MKRSILFIIILLSVNVGLSQLGPRQESQKLVQDGDNFLNRGDWNQALIYYTKAISIDRTYARAYMKRALVYKLIQRYREAEIDFSYALRINPYSEYIYNERAKLKMIAMDYKGAMEDITQALKINPDNTESRELQYQDLIAMKNYDMALKTLDSLEHENDSTRYNFLLKTTYIYMLQKDWENADFYLDSVVEINKDSYVAMDLKGMIMFQQKRYDESIEFFTKAIKLNPDFAIAYFNRSLAYRAKGDKESALEDLNKSIEIKESKENVLLARAVIRKEMGSMDEALDDYNAALKSNPDFENALYNRAFTNQFLGNEAQAFEDVKRLIELNPDDAKNWNLKGNIELLFGKYDAAINSYTEAIAIDLDYAEAYYNRGLAYYMSNRAQFGCQDVEVSKQLGYERAENLLKYLCSD